GSPCTRSSPASAGAEARAAPDVRVEPGEHAPEHRGRVHVAEARKEHATESPARSVEAIDPGACAVNGTDAVGGRGTVALSCPRQQVARGELAYRRCPSYL